MNILGDFSSFFSFYIFMSIIYNFLHRIGTFLGFISFWTEVTLDIYFKRKSFSEKD